MLTIPASGGGASTASSIDNAVANLPVAVAASASDPRLPQQPPPADEPSGEKVRHMIFGSTDAVRKAVHNLHSRGYADPNDWSPAISTGRFNEVMKLLIKRVSTD